MHSLRSLPDREPMKFARHSARRVGCEKPTAVPPGTVSTRTPSKRYSQTMGSAGTVVPGAVSCEICHCSQRASAEVRRRLYRDSCLLYTSDAADEEDSVDLGGRR